MGYHPDRRNTTSGYACFTVPISPDALRSFLRKEDRVYSDGNRARVVAPVQDEHAATTLAERVRTAFNTTVTPEFRPKEEEIIIGNLEINTRTKIARLYSARPLTQHEIAETLTTYSQQDPTAFAHVEAIYVRTNEPASYFTAQQHADELALTSRMARRSLDHIPVRAAVHRGFIVCPIKPGSEPSYHSVTKTLSLKTREQ